MQSKGTMVKLVVQYNLKLSLFRNQIDYNLSPRDGLQFDIFIESIIYTLEAHHV